MITTIIFDMNGVITDDEEIHEIATQKIFESIGIDLTSEIYRELCLGRTDLASFKDLMKYYEVSNQNMEELIAAKSAKYQMLIQGNLKVYPGVIALVKRLNNKYTLALTSSSTYEEVHTVISQLEIKKYFKIIVTSKDVVHGKPDPEPYILTAKKLKVNCENCLVLEDSENGVQSAVTAGMKCVAITTTEDPNKLTKADIIIDDYSELTDDFIQNV